MKLRDGQNVLALAVGGLALAILTTGTAVATTGQLVHVSDPTTGLAAKVYGGGQLLVGDGSGPVTVDGTVTARETPPTQLTRATRYSDAKSGCVPVLTAPADRAVVIKTILINVSTVGHQPEYERRNPTPSGGGWVGYYVGTACNNSTYITHVSPPSFGLTSVPLEPGIVVPAGESLNVSTNRDFEVYSTAIGYFIPASAAPATSESAGSAFDGPSLPH